MAEGEDITSYQLSYFGVFSITVVSPFRGALRIRRAQAWILETSTCEFRQHFIRVPRSGQG
jgi:hypothetical protein